MADMERESRIGVIGASSLTGKELADALNESPLAAAKMELLDTEEMTGQITAAGDEATVIQTLDAESFDGMDFAFFTGSPAMTAAQWQKARRAGASIVDLTYALEGQKEVLVWSPWVAEALGGQAGSRLTLSTAAVISAHPAAVMLALVAARLKSQGLAGIMATVMQPASEQGSVAMDELHQQTVNLLSFQPLPKAVYDAQVSFNLLPGLGEAALMRLGEVRQRIEAHYAALGEGMLPEIAVQMVQAPVFHGYMASVLVELNEASTVPQIEEALAGAHVEIAEESDGPSNVTVAGQDQMAVRVSAAGQDGRRFWLWLAADNLKLHALNAVACAVALERLRPRGTVQ